MSHKDPVTPEMRMRVLTRDLWEIMRQTEPRPIPPKGSKDWLYTQFANVYEEQLRRRAVEAARGPLGRVCVAPLIDFSESQNCSGRTTLEHVKDDLRMGVRAPSDLGHLVSLCEGHTEAGAKAGYQWNTDKRNRAKLREYLRRVNAGQHLVPGGPAT